MICGSLFSGVGGMDLGLHRAGFQHEFFCEKDAYRRRVLERHWPGARVYDDVFAVGRKPEPVGRAGQADTPGRGRRNGSRPERPEGRRMARHDAHLDLLSGGFPCQDLSVAGKRAGLSGERSGLFFEFMRVADVLVRPGGWVLVENVPGLLSSNGGRDFAVVLASLAELGFHDLAWRVLDSRHFGVPQRRRRVFVLARRASGSGAREVLLEPEGGEGDSEAGGEAGEGSAASFGVGVAGALGGGRGYRNDLDSHGAYVNGTAKTLTAPERWDAETEDFVAISENQRAEVLETPYARQLTSGGGKAGQGYAAARIGSQVRRLTPVECERLQGWPDGWTLDHGPSLADEPNHPHRTDEVCPKPDGPRYAAAGDGVTAPVSQWIGSRLLAHIESERRAVA